MCLGSCPGPRGLAMAVASLICMMFKHKFVDGSGPPPEGFVMAFAVLAAQLYAGQSSMDEHKSKIGTYVFTGWMLLCAPPVDTPHRLPPAFRARQFSKQLLQAQTLPS